MRGNQGQEGDGPRAISLKTDFRGTEAKACTASGSSSRKGERV